MRDEDEIRNKIAMLKEQIAGLEQQLEWLEALKPKPGPCAFTSGDPKIKARFAR